MHYIYAYIYNAFFYLILTQKKYGLVPIISPHFTDGETKPQRVKVTSSTSPDSIEGCRKNKILTPVSYF